MFYAGKLLDRTTTAVLLLDLRVVTSTTVLLLDLRVVTSTTAVLLLDLHAW